MPCVRRVRARRARANRTDRRAVRPVPRRQAGSPCRRPGPPRALVVAPWRERRSGRVRSPSRIRQDLARPRALDPRADRTPAERLAPEPRGFRRPGIRTSSRPIRNAGCGAREVQDRCVLEDLLAALLGLALLVYLGYALVRPERF
ncbi:MAG: potassium-transporting ATPase subunit F [Micropruina sp.]|nr:potassium-transporting ATPase subunit F [Micropruina sp.]